MKKPIIVLVILILAGGAFWSERQQFGRAVEERERVRIELKQLTRHAMDLNGDTARLESDLAQREQTLERQLDQAAAETEALRRAAATNAFGPPGGVPAWSDQDAFVWMEKRRFPTLNVAVSEEHVEGSSGYQQHLASFKVAAFPDEGGALKAEWMAQLNAVLGANRAEHLLQMSADWIRSDLGDFGEAERTITIRESAGSGGFNGPKQSGEAALKPPRLRRQDKLESLGVMGRWSRDKDLFDKTDLPRGHARRKPEEPHLDAGGRALDGPPHGAAELFATASFAQAWRESGFEQARRHAKEGRPNLPLLQRMEERAGERRHVHAESAMRAEFGIRIAIGLSPQKPEMRPHFPPLPFSH